MAKSMEQKLAHLSEAAKQRTAEQQDLLLDDVEEATSDIISMPARRTGKSARSIRRETKKTLERYANEMGIEQKDFWPGQEFPTLFTRLPIFPPIQRSRAREQQASQLKNSDFVRLSSKWEKGGVWRSGPALTVYDEDTLAALMQMRTIEFSGNELLMPSKQSKRNKMTTVSHGKKVTVHAVYCVISELECLIRGEDAPKKGWSGKIIKQRRESIERLAATTLRFEQPKGLDMYRGKLIPLIEVDWAGDPRNACYYVQFHPAIVAWLKDYHTFIDLNIRRLLTPFGKALHRFLASQTSNRNYEIDFETILEAIGYDGVTSEAKRKSISQLEKLKEVNFIEAFEFRGNGRREPFKLLVQYT
jgi:hypothetical protein